MSTKVNIYNQKAEPVGELKLSDQVFGVKANKSLVHQAVVAQMGNERQVLAHTKDRSEVRGGGRKPWRQKGTGRARAGSIRSPIWKGGGVTFGPAKDRNFKKNINQKMRQKAMLMALSDRVAGNNLIVLDKLAMPEFKTKTFEAMLKALEKNIFPAGQGILQQSQDKPNSRQPQNSESKSRKNSSKASRSILIINDKKDNKVKYSGRNLTGVKIINLDNINILDLLRHRHVIITKAGAKKLEERYK